jgi:hypothetical protein
MENEKKKVVADEVGAKKFELKFSFFFFLTLLIGTMRNGGTGARLASGFSSASPARPQYHILGALCRFCGNT